MPPRLAAWSGLLAVLTLAVAGCGSAEPRVVRVTVALDANVPAFDSVQVGMSSFRGGEDIDDQQLQLGPRDFGADRTSSLELFIPERAELVEVQADVLAGTETVGHGRRSVATFGGQSYDLIVTVLPTPVF